MRRNDFNLRLVRYIEFFGQNRCWCWMQDRDVDRERVTVNGKRILVRRHIYELVRAMGPHLGGPLKKNQPLVRTCGRENCVNPWHHVPAISARELIETGDWRGEPNDPRGAHNREKARCPYGHAYSSGNTSYTRDGRRRCLACHRERAWLPLSMRWIAYGSRDAVAARDIMPPVRLR